MTEYYTIDTGELAPYPGMTQEDLQDFEDWAARCDEDYQIPLGLYLTVGIVLIYLLIRGLT